MELKLKAYSMFLLLLLMKKSKGYNEKHCECIHVSFKFRGHCQ